MPEVIVIPQKEKKSNKRLRVAAYCRVSTQTNDQEASLKSQVKKYESEIRRNPDWDFVGVYCDTKSGLRVENRKSFNEMIEKCKIGEIDLILVKSISRFGRNVYDGLVNLRYLKSLGVDVWIEMNGMKLSTSSDSDFAIMLTVAQSESESKSGNIKFGIEYGFKTGKSKIYNRICYGYSQDENGNLIINEFEATIVKLIFEMYLSGYSLSGISKELENAGIKSPTGKDKWSSETISKLLSNEKLTGDVIGQKTYVKNFLDGKQVKNCGQMAKYLVSNHHEPIITKSMFNRIQQEKENRSNVSTVKNKTVRKKNRYSNDLLSGRIFCSECGASYRRRTRQTKKGNELFWRCANRIEHGNRNCKNSITVSNDEIEKAIADKLLLYKYDEEVVKQYLDRIEISNEIAVGIKDYNENELYKIREYQMSQAALDGDRIALNLLYEESFKKIKEFIRNNLWKSGFNTYWQMMRDYDDICQDALLRSFEILHKYHGKCRFASWVTKIAYYIIGNRLNKLRRNKEDLMNIEDFDVYVSYRNQ